MPAINNMQAAVFRALARDSSEQLAELSPDARYAVCWRADGAINLWDLQRRERLLSMPNPFGHAVVTFFADSRFVAIQPPSHPERQYPKPESYAPMLFELPAAVRIRLPDVTRRAAVSADGATIALASETDVALVDAKTKAPFAQWQRSAPSKGAARRIEDLTFAPDGGAVVERADARPYLWMAATRSRHAMNLGGHIEAPTVVRFLEGGRVVLSISDRIMVHRVSDGDGLELVYSERPGPRGAFAFVAPNGKFDGPLEALELLRERSGDRLIEVTERSAGHEPDLYRKWLVSASAR
jgi:hypothetical protein